MEEMMDYYGDRGAAEGRSSPRHSKTPKTPKAPKPPRRKFMDVEDAESDDERARKKREKRARKEERAVKGADDVTQVTLNGSAVSEAVATGQGREDGGKKRKEKRDKKDKGKRRAEDGSQAGHGSAAGASDQCQDEHFAAGGSLREEDDETERKRLKREKKERKKEKREKKGRNQKESQAIDKADEHEAESKERKKEKKERKEKKRLERERASMVGGHGEGSGGHLAGIDAAKESARSAPTVSKPQEEVPKTKKAKRDTKNRKDNHAEDANGGSGNGMNRSEAVTQEAPRESDRSAASAMTHWEAKTKNNRKGKHDEVGKKDGGDKKDKKDKSTKEDKIDNAGSGDRDTAAGLDTASSAKETTADNGMPAGATSSPVETAEPSATADSPKAPVRRQTRSSKAATTISPSAEAGPSNADSFRAPTRKRKATDAASGEPKKKGPDITDEALKRQLSTPAALNAWLAEKSRKNPELLRLEKAGVITFRRGKFTVAEKDAIKAHFETYKKIHMMDDDALLDLIMRPARTISDDSFWPEVAAVCPGRPLSQVRSAVKWMYDERTKLGRWTPEEDQELIRAYQAHPGQWKKIGDEIGRTLHQVRDRYRDVISAKETRVTGRWTAGEEDELAKIVRECNLEIGLDPLGVDAPWEAVAQKMDNTRTALQCRNKWQVQLRFSEINKGRRAVFTDAERPYLVHQLMKSGIEHEVDIEWSKQATGTFESISGYALKTGYNSMKRHLDIPAGTPFPEILDRMKKRWPFDSSSLPSKTLKSVAKADILGWAPKHYLTKKPTKPKIVSQDFIEASDDDDEEGGEPRAVMQALAVLGDTQANEGPAAPSKEVPKEKTPGPGLLASLVKEIGGQGGDDSGSDSDMGSESD